MDTRNVPLASYEVRWFLAGAVDEHRALKSWLETAAPIQKKGDVGPPTWKGRLDDQPDVYLLVPGADDMGIKWREGEFQIKGRVASLGTQVFCGRFHGKVERWMKWSYAKMPESYRRLVLHGKESGLVTVSVRKTRALRKVRLDTLKGTAEEVDPTAFLDRGLGLELTDLKIGGRAYCSVAFEAFPDDSTMGAAFTQTVDAFLDTLKGVDLPAAHSLSYPAWLGSLEAASRS